MENRIGGSAQGFGYVWNGVQGGARDGAGRGDEAAEGCHHAGEGVQEEDGGDRR